VHTRLCTREIPEVFRAREAVPQAHGDAARRARTLRASPNTHLVFLSELVLSLHSAVLPDTAPQSQHKTADAPAVVRHGSNALYAFRITAERSGPGHEQHHEQHPAIGHHFHHRHRRIFPCTAVPAGQFNYQQKRDPKETQIKRHSRSQRGSIGHSWRPRGALTCLASGTHKKYKTRTDVWVLLGARAREHGMHRLPGPPSFYLLLTHQRTQMGGTLMSALRVDDLDAWHEEMTADRVWFQTF